MAVATEGKEVGISVVFGVSVYMVGIELYAWLVNSVSLAALANKAVVLLTVVGDFVPVLRVSLVHYCPQGWLFFLWPVPDGVYLVSGDAGDRSDHSS